MTTGKAAANKVIEKGNDTYLVCRSIGHMFDEQTSRVERSAGRFRWSMDCSRCGTTRTKTLSLNGRIVASSYAYPKDYKAPGIGRLDVRGMAHLRLYVITNVLGG